METFFQAETAANHGSGLTLYHTKHTKRVLYVSIGRIATGAFWIFVRHNGFGREARELNTSASILDSSLRMSFQNSAGLVEIATRSLVAALASAFLMIPVIISSYQSALEVIRSRSRLVLPCFHWLYDFCSRPRMSQPWRHLRDMRLCWLLFWYINPMAPHNKVITITSLI